MKLPGIEVLIKGTGGEKIKRAYYLDKNVVKMLKILSLIEGKSMSKIIEEAVRKYFEEKTKEIPEDKIEAIKRIISL